MSGEREMGEWSAAKIPSRKQTEDVVVHGCCLNPETTRAASFTSLFLSLDSRLELLSLQGVNLEGIIRLVESVYQLMSHATWVDTASHVVVHILYCMLEELSWLPILKQLLYLLLSLCCHWLLYRLLTHLTWPVAQIINSCFSLYLPQLTVVATTYNAETTNTKSSIQQQTHPFVGPFQQQKRSKITLYISDGTEWHFTL